MIFIIGYLEYFWIIYYVRIMFLKHLSFLEPKLQMSCFV